MLKKILNFLKKILKIKNLYPLCYFVLKEKNLSPEKIDKLITLCDKITEKVSSKYNETIIVDLFEEEKTKLSPEDVELEKIIILTPYQILPPFYENLINDVVCFFEKEKIKIKKVKYVLL